MESFQSQNKRTERLTDLCLRVIGNQAGKKDIDDLAADINNVEPNEVISIVEVVIKKGKDMDDNKRRLSKVLNIIHKGISNYKWKLPDENLFLKDMMKENSHLKERLNKLKKYMKGINESEGFFSMARSDMNSFLDNVLILKEIEYHYLKKENILFPYLEKHGGHLKCLPVMWSIHDDVRSSLKHIGQLREKGVKDVKTLLKIIGEIFFSMYAMIFREELILYPAASGILEGEEWEMMLNESYEIGFSFITAPERKKDKVSIADILVPDLIDTGTGKLSLDILKLILNSLPLDITFVDENDRVVYFSQPKNRIFTRTIGILGREVKNCHPPESIDKVNGIIDSFRNGTSSKESFRIYIKGRYILIEYYALCDNSNRYRGTLEVTSDITDISEYEGEKRL